MIEHAQESHIVGAFDQEQCFGFLRFVIQEIGRDAGRTTIVHGGAPLREGFVEALLPQPGHEHRELRTQDQSRVHTAPKWRKRFVLLRKAASIADSTGARSVGRRADNRNQVRHAESVIAHKQLQITTTSPAQGAGYARVIGTCGSNVSGWVLDDCFEIDVYVGRFCTLWQDVAQHPVEYGVDVLNPASVDEHARQRVQGALDRRVQPAAAAR